MKLRFDVLEDRCNPSPLVGATPEDPTGNPIPVGLDGVPYVASAAPPGVDVDLLETPLDKASNAVADNVGAVMILVRDDPGVPLVLAGRAVETNIWVAATTSHDADIYNRIFASGVANGQWAVTWNAGVAGARVRPDIDHDFELPVVPDAAPTQLEIAQNQVVNNVADAWLLVVLPK